MLHALKWLPAIIFFVAAAAFFAMSLAGDNSDARALAGIMIFPAILCAVLAVIAGVLAWVL